jgi:hypothetical protein
MIRFWNARIQRTAVFEYFGEMPAVVLLRVLRGSA